MVKIRLGSVLEMTFILYKASFVLQLKTQELMVEFCSPKRPPRGMLEFLSPCTTTTDNPQYALKALDYLYLVDVLHRHL